uniref:Matrilin 2 n=1 Tax=Cynoglossus semilaevis TaxID=244447 RepID=A0A3P8VJH4_CYNSE
QNSFVYILVFQKSLYLIEDWKSNMAACIQPAGDWKSDMANPCKAIPLDFFFVIDSSRSIRPHDYEKVKTFIINLLQFLKVGPDDTRVGLLQYGSIVQPEFSLKTYSTKAEVEQAVRNMEHLATGTMTGLAIQYTMETAFTEEEGARPASFNIPRIAMVVTDGRPQDTVEGIAAEARQAGIQIFAIGVGRVDMNILKAIGSEPHSEHVHLVANFSQIETLTSVFHRICKGKAEQSLEKSPNQCLCENIIKFQNRVSEKLINLMQNNILLNRIMFSTFSFLPVP